MLKQLAIVLSVTALIACGEDAVVATEKVEAPVVEVVTVQETVVTEETSIEATAEAAASGTVEG